MRTITIELAANVETTRALAGKYVRVIEADAAFQLRADGGIAFDVERGIGIPRSAGFAELSLLSTTAQSVTLAVSDERVDDSRVSLTNGMTLETSYGYADASIYNVGSLEVETLVTPAANTGGIIVYSFVIISATGNTQLVHGTSAPVTQFDGTCKTICLLSSTGVQRGIHTMPQKIEAGRGIYAAKAAATFQAIELAYRLL